MRSAITIIPFFDSLGPSTLKFVLHQTELTTMCVEESGLDNLIKIKNDCPHLKNIVVFDKITQEKK